MAFVAFAVAAKTKTPKKKQKKERKEKQNWGSALTWPYWQVRIGMGEDWPMPVIWYMTRRGSGTGPA